jgi:hypothetical protein
MTEKTLADFAGPLAGISEYINNTNGLEDLKAPLSQAANVARKAIVASVLSEKTLTGIREELNNVHLGISILMGVLVVMILISLVFLIYNAVHDTSGLANNIITLTLAIMVTISFAVLKGAFYGIDLLLFDNQTGAIRVMKNMLTK